MIGQASKIVIPVVDEGLGNSSYLVDLGDGRALAIDASLDLRSLREQADRLGLTVVFAAETHLHADFVSGALQLAAEDGAKVLASRAGQREFGHVGLVDGDEVDLGGLTLRVLATPGHTGEHLSYELLDGRSLLGVFTGGSLIVGGAARTDLAGADLTDVLARAQYRSLRRLITLPDETPVWPTHGAGSFCSAPNTNGRTSTIGQEKVTNPLLAIADEKAFVSELLAGLGSYPPYFLRLAEANRAGRTVPCQPTVPGLDADRVAALLADGVVLVDVRPIGDFASAHVPGALSIQLRSQYASWLGWLLEPARPYLVLRNSDQDLDELVWQALKIGFEPPVGELAGGIAAWDRATTSTPLLKPDQIGAASMVDVRQTSEFHTGHVPGASHIELGDLAAAALAGPVVTMCGHGERAMTGASILERGGHPVVGVLDGGPEDWAEATGRALA
jgi:glyoxylase-like metal-dependent hydrolase (beta-lactamase superfamily II)/rhodanese-related sulfurtransferase